MNENNTNGGLLNDPQTKPKNYVDPFKQAAKRSEPSISKSKGAQAQKPTATKRATQQDKLAAVTDLLSGTPSGDLATDHSVDDATQLGGQTDTDARGVGPSGDGDAGDSGDADAVPQTAITGELSVKDLAERLGTTPKKLYDSLQVTTQEGETLTLGEAKDRIQTQEAATREIVERETAISTRESAMLQNMQLLQSVMGDLKGKLDPQTINKLQAQTQETEARERSMMLQTMPELSDPAQLETFRTDVAEHMQAYGFRPNELVIRDHRIALAIKDLIKTKRQLAKLMEFQPKQDPPKTHKPQGKQRRPNRSAETIANARNSTRPQAKAAAVNAILQEAKR